MRYPDDRSEDSVPSLTSIPPTTQAGSIAEDTESSVDEEAEPERIPVDPAERQQHIQHWVRAMHGQTRTVHDPISDAPEGAPEMGRPLGVARPAEETSASSSLDRTAVVHILRPLNIELELLALALIERATAQVNEIQRAQQDPLPETPQGTYLILATCAAIVHTHMQRNAKNQLRVTERDTTPRRQTARDGKGVQAHPIKSYRTVPYI